MSRRKSVNWFLIIFFGVYFVAAIFRIEFFPLTWVPMYARYEHKPVFRSRMVEKDTLRKGFKVMRRNGEVDFLGPKDLNMPFGNFRRLYTQRAFDVGPPKFLIQRTSLNPLNAWLHNTLVGEDPRTSIDWEKRLLHSLNATYNLSPEDPEFIISASATIDFIYFKREDLLESDLTNPRQETREKVLRWRNIQ